MTRRGSIFLSTANEIGSALVTKLGGSGYSPKEWGKKANIMGIASADIPDALANLTPSAGGGDRGSIEITLANEIGAVLNKKFQTERGFKPKEWASAISKLTPLQVKTASGAIASFSDGADAVPLTSLIANIDPKQDLHGYSKPWAPGAGNNKLALFSLDFTLNNVHFYTQNGLFYIDGTSTGETSSKHAMFSQNLSFVISAGAYYFSRGTVLQGLNVATYLYKKSDDTQIVANNGSFTLSEDTEVYVGFYIYQKTFANVAPDIMLNVGSSAMSWEPYSNVCPIEGSTETTAYQYGKNLFNYEAVEPFNANVIITRNNGDYTIQNNNSYAVGAFRGILFHLKPASYSLSLGEAIASPIRIYKNDVWFNNGINAGSTSCTFTVTEEDDYTFACNVSANSSLTVKKCQFELGSTATAFEAFKQKTPVTVSFGRTVYTGEYNFIDSKLKLSSVLLSLNVDDMNNSENYPGWRNAGVKDLGVETGVYNNKMNVGNSYNVNTSGNNDIIYLSTNTYGLTQTEWKTLSAGLTITVEVMLPEPIIIDLEDPQEVESYLGVNNIYNDTGDTSASYYADIDLDNA